MHGLAVRSTTGGDRITTSAGHPDDAPLASEPHRAARRAADPRGDVASPGDTAAGIAAAGVERASAG